MAHYRLVVGDLRTINEQLDKTPNLRPTLMSVVQMTGPLAEKLQPHGLLFAVMTQEGEK